MKRKLILFVLSTCVYALCAQTFCVTPQTSSNMDKFSSILRSANTLDKYTLRIYIHVIRKSDGRGGQSEKAVARAVEILNDDFNPHGIYFQQEGGIDYIDTDTYYSTPSVDIFKINNHTDGIDIYLFDDSAESVGKANGVGNSSECWISGSYWHPPYGSLITSHIISHEMGHVLFLWHTHHGTYFETGDPHQCAELVDGSNAKTCGDYISDTPADPHLNFNVDYTTCTWKGSGEDENGDSYNPDVALIMSYSHPDCMSYFTLEQGQRMRNAIATLPFLQQTVIDCDNIFVKNRTISADEHVEGCNIFLENVTIEKKAKVIANARENTTLKKNIEVKLGASLEVK